MAERVLKKNLMSPLLLNRFAVCFIGLYFTTRTQEPATIPVQNLQRSVVSFQLLAGAHQNFLALLYLAGHDFHSFLSSSCFFSGEQPNTCFKNVFPDSGISVYYYVCLCLGYSLGAERLSSMLKTFGSLSRTGKTKEVDRSDLRVINCLKMSSASFKLSVGISFSMPLPPYFGGNPVILGLNYLPGPWKWKFLEARNFIILPFSFLRF